MKIVREQAEIEKLLRRSQLNKDAVNQTVKSIIADVRAHGDSALSAYTEKFDRYAGALTVTPEERQAAYAQVPKETLAALRRARDNIIAYHKRQLRPDNVQTENGRTTGYVIRAVDRAGIYVPGGKAAYPSSVLMCACPAMVAGVNEIVMVTPAPGGTLNPLTVVAACECGIERIFKIGGAQAVAALAYGTETIPRVDVISGPGNIYVAVAKREVYGDVGIDMIAGPSEILILADATANPEFLAADILSQAEHDELSMSMLITNDIELTKKTQLCVTQQLEKLPKRDIAAKALENHGAVVLVSDMREAVALANRVAPEHLELCVADPDALLPAIRNAGAVFMGHYTPEPIGDYYAGPNHVLPTSGTARFFSALGVDQYTKRMSVVRYTETALMADAQDIMTLAQTEGLFAHANAIKVRI
ncbi:MAG: histidinol dehydrogenase [Clostridia bacterium]|nr:histidinol dehydrogenase [Clostridia bacterium]